MVVVLRDLAPNGSILVGVLIVLKGCVDLPQVVENSSRNRHRIRLFVFGLLHLRAEQVH